MKTKPSEIESAIVRRIKPPEGTTADAVYDFQCPRTGRQFMIRRYDDDYFLEELVPIGIWDEQIKSRTLEPLFEKVSTRAQPNDFKHVLLRKLSGTRSLDCPGDSRYLIIRGTVGEGMPIYSHSLSECAGRIRNALNANAYYQAWQTPAEKTKAEEINEVKQMIFYWQLILKAVEVIEPDTVFKGTFTTMGGRIDDELKKDLLTYFNAPSHELWDRLFSQCIVHKDTLWKAWCDYDPTAPQTINQEGERVWPKIPDGEQLREAIRACVQSTRERAEEALSQNTAILKRLQHKGQPSLKLVKNPGKDDREQCLG